MQIIQLVKGEEKTIQIEAGLQPELKPLPIFAFTCITHLQFPSTLDITDVNPISKACMETSL